MTNPTEGVLSGADIEDLSGWLIHCRRTDDLEKVFVDHASSIVGWFCLLLDEVERLNVLVEDLNELEATQIHILPREADRCEDFECSHCYPSHTCFTLCDSQGHEWMDWDEEPENGPIFCIRCGKRREELRWIGEDDDFDPSYCWVRFDDTQGEHSLHDWALIGDFRDDHGTLLSSNKDERRMCKSCEVVEPPKHGREFYSDGSPKAILINDHTPLDNGPDALKDPDDCDHTDWHHYDDSGWSRCLGCGFWVQPMDQCPAAPDHNVIAVGVGVISWVCQHCHQEFDGKPPSNTPRGRTNDTIDNGPVLPDPVGYVTPDVQERLPMEVPKAIPLGPVGGTEADDDAGDECSVDCTDPVCAKFHGSPSPVQEEWDHEWQKPDEESPFEEPSCGLCGWSDPHTHSGPGVLGATPTKVTALDPLPPPVTAAQTGKLARRARRFERVQARDRVDRALQRAEDRLALPGTTPPLALTEANPVMRMHQCFRCERELDFDKGELTVCSSCSEDDMIAAEVRAAEAEQLALLDLFVRLRAETVYLDDPDVIDVESTEVEIDHEDSPFTCEAAYQQQQDQPVRTIDLRTHESGGWAA